MAGIYIHIPFCAKRCIYCGFFSTVRQEEAARYVKAVCRELVERKTYLEDAPVCTIYFGGGTPSRLTPGQIGDIVNTIASVFGLDYVQELTVECNPDDITPQFVSALRGLGVNRISMGVQTFSDELLCFLHRRHTASQALDAVRICRESDIENISIDLMYGLPGQTLDMFRADLETALLAGVQHISSYCLSYEENTPLLALRDQGKLIPATDELCSRMFTLMCSTLRDAGFDHYEISNFCRPGYHSRHNSSYWYGTPYLGVGAGAHSYNGTSRQWNPSDLDAYMNAIEHGTPVFEQEHLSSTDLYNEKLMLSLRTSRGLNLSSLAPSDRLSVLHSAQRLLSNGSLLLENNTLRIPESRMFISDSIISTLFKD
ncbi:MAG: radical SAM family heme chaperone HemW [Bacteroidaceae bacterium]|nr:radical SAM family heme chaperone HemW [Bacteroidaceae bacterium]